jgi:transposase
VTALDPRDVRIAELEALVTALTAKLEVALGRIGDLEARVVSLSRNSTNSSKPPSSDPPSVTRPPTPPSGKKRGGQPGH